MTINRFKEASRFAALDSETLTSGSPVSAHLLRTMSMTANRAIRRKDHVATLYWDGSTDGNAIQRAQLQFSGGLDWTEVLAGTRIKRKPPGLDALSFYIYYLSDDAGMYFQAATLDSPLDVSARTANVPNVGILTETAGVFTLASLEKVPCSTGEHEAFSLFVRAGPLDTQPGVGGSVTGDLVEAHENFIVDSGTDWDKTGVSTDSFDRQGCVVTVTDGTTVLLSARKIVRVFDYLWNDAGTIKLGQALAVDPPIDSDTIKLISEPSISPVWDVYRLPRGRIASISIYAEPRLT